MSDDAQRSCYEVSLPYRYESVADLADLGRRVLKAMRQADEVRVYTTKSGSIRVVPCRLEPNVT